MYVYWLGRARYYTQLLLHVSTMAEAPEVESLSSTEEYVSADEGTEDGFISR